MLELVISSQKTHQDVTDKSVTPARFRPVYFRRSPHCASSASASALSLCGVQVGGNAVTMGKKKALSNTQTSKAAAKAAKKAKAAQKTERKEKRKSGKGKDEFDDDQDLEAILENVSDYLPLLHHLV